MMNSSKRQGRRAISESTPSALKQPAIVAKRRRDGSFVRVMLDGTTTPLPDRTDWERLRRMTDDEVEAAALADADTRPMSPEERESARPVPRTKTLRRALGLTQ